MRLSSVLCLLVPLAVNAINIIQSNDDGWAEINIREFYASLTKAGFNSIISAPAENQSGSGSSDEEPDAVGSEGCEFQSCPAGSPSIGNNASMPRFNYVNSYPVTSMRYGIQNLSQTFFHGAPDLAVAGPNVGSNLGIITQFSGTVGASVEATKLGIPAVAFSGTTGTQTAWTANPEPYTTLYADLATTIVQALISHGPQDPYLPPHTWLNVNFPAVTDECASLADFRFVLSRIYPAIPFITKDDVETCGRKRLPRERTVVGSEGCYVSITLANTEKRDASAAQQAVVLERLKCLLTCLPED